jgi:multiple sugar transport system substrate-binding protein
MRPSQRLKAIAAVPAACAVAATATACSGSSSPSSDSPISTSSLANASSTAPVTISVNCEPPTSTPRPRANWVADVAAFEKLYPYITIKSDDADPCDNPATFNAQLASGKMDNVFHTYVTDAGNVISSGQSADSPSSPS